MSLMMNLDFINKGVNLVDTSIFNNLISDNYYYYYEVTAKILNLNKVSDCNDSLDDNKIFEETIIMNGLPYSADMIMMYNGYKNDYIKSLTGYKDERCEREYIDERHERNFDFMEYVV